MLKEKNNQIARHLMDATKTGNLHWQENPGDNNKRKYQRIYSATGQDGTKYEIEVKFTLTGDVFKIETTPSLWIRNKDLPNGIYYVSNLNCDMLPQLRDLIREMFCPDLDPTADVLIEKLDEICKGISLEIYRDNKLKDIL